MKKISIESRIFVVIGTILSVIYSIVTPYVLFGSELPYTALALQLSMFVVFEIFTITLFVFIKIVKNKS